MNFYSTVKSKFIFFSLVLALGAIGLSTTLLAQSNSLVEEDAVFSEKWELKLNHATSPTHSHVARNEKTHRSCLSLVLLEGANNKKRLTPRLQRVLRTYEERPTLSFSVDSRHFRIHYEKTGINAVSQIDDNDNQIPDYIEFVAFEFENVYKKEIEDLGYIAPPSDGERGGGQDLYDVYITDLQQGLYGYVFPETRVGDNPNSSATETQASTSFLRMRNNYEGFGLQNDALKVTAAHEYFHSIQVGYNRNTPSRFALEGSASWMEEVIYPGIDDNFQYLESVLGSPDVALNYDLSDDDDPDYFDNQNIWYGSWIFFQYIGENYGKEVIRAFWENLRSDSELDAFNDALLSKNISLNTAFEDFFVANIVMSASSASNPFVYARAADYLNYLRQNIDSETIKLEGTMNFAGQSTSWNSSSQGNRRLMRFSSDYIKLNTQEKEFKVEITPAGVNNEIGVQFVSFQPNGQVRVIKNYPTAGTDAKIEVKDINSAEQMYLIVYRLGRLNDDFTSKQYVMKVSKIDEVTGIENNLGENNYFKIASNPVSDNLRFVYQLENQNLQNYKVNVTDILGRKMISNNSINQSISTSRWAKGTYFVTLLDNQKPIAVRKIIVR